MGIQLDWEVESDSGHSAVAEDAQVIAAEKRRANFNRRALIVLAVILIIGGSIAWYRAKIVRDEKLRVLHLTVEAEALALRLGDEDKFMSLQGPADDWRSEQRAHFDQMVAQPDVVIEGTILDLDMTNTEARVVVAMQVNGQPARAVWLYQYLDKGWRHTSTEEEPWSERTDVSGSFIFTYHSMDQASVDHLRALLDGWWARAAADLYVDEPPILAVTLDQQATRIQWDEDRDNLVIIPTSFFRDGEMLASRRWKLARLVSEYWAAHLLQTHSASSVPDSWLQQETAVWLEARLGGKPEYQSSLFYLSDVFGDDVIPTFFALNHETGDPDEALRAALARHAPHELNAAYFTHYLEAVQAMMQSSREGDDWFDLATIPLIDPPAMEDGGLSVGIMMLAGGRPNSLTVEDVQRFQDLYWVTGSVDVNAGMFSDSPSPARIERTMFMIPFREVNGYYQISAMQADDWGATLVEQSPYVTFEYSELDAPYLGGLAAQLERDYLQAASMFGMSNTPHITIRVMQDLYGDEPPSGGIAPMIFSPHQICCFPGYDPQEFSRLYYVYQLYAAIFNAQASAYKDPAAYSPPVNLFENAIINAAARRNGYDLALFNGGIMTVSAQSNDNLPESLNALWAAAASGIGQVDWQIQQVGAEVLIEVLIDRYGQQVIVPLTQNLRNSFTMEEWLFASLGISSQDVDAEWLARLQQEVQLSNAD